MFSKIIPYFSKFVDSDFRESSGKSWAMIQMNGKTYKAWAKCNPEDEPSKFLGCQIAEIRAQIKGLKDMKKVKVQEEKDWRIFVKKCEQYKGFDKESPTAKAMYRQLNRKKREIENLNEYINSLYELIDQSVSMHSKVKEKYAKKG